MQPSQPVDSPARSGPDDAAAAAPGDPDTGGVVPGHRRGPGLLVSAALLGSALALTAWLLTLPHIDPAGMDGRGLLAVLPPAWFGALGLALVSTCVLVVAPRSGRVASFVALGVLIMIMYGTTSAVYAEPRFYWTYKHLGVVDYLIAHHGVNRSLDIYQNWPGFFALAAVVVSVTGLSVRAIAQWSEPAFATVAALAVYWTARGFDPSPALRGRRRRADVVAPAAFGRPLVPAQSAGPARTAPNATDAANAANAANAAEGSTTTWVRVALATAVLFTVTNWIGQNYFSPQAFAFPLSVLVIGQMVRMVPRPLSGSLRYTFSGSWRPTRHREPTTGMPDVFWAGRGGAAVCLITYLAVAMSHQLSPVMVIVQSGVLVVLLRVRHWWLPAAFVGAELMWLIPAWGYVSRHFTLIDLRGISNVEPPATAPRSTLPWVQLLSWTPRLLVALVALAAMAAVGRLVLTRRAHWVLVPLALAAAPVSVVVVQPYGQEGIFRAYLFALPWATLLAASALVGRRRPTHPAQFARRVSPLRSGALLLTVTSIFTTLWLPASFAMELVNRVHPSDLRAVHWVADHATDGAGFLSAAPGLPWEQNADRPLYRQTWFQAMQPLAAWPQAADAIASGPAALVAFTNEAASWYPHGVYLVLGPGQRDHLKILRQLGNLDYDEYVRRISVDPMFELVYTDGETRVWKYLGVPAT